MFTRQSPDADAPDIEVIWELVCPTDPTLRGEPFCLTPISMTRQDTREPIAWEDAEERRRILVAVTDWVAARYESGTDVLTLT